MGRKAKFISLLLSFALPLLFLSTPVLAQENSTISDTDQMQRIETESGALYISSSSDTVQNDVENDVVFTGGDLVIDGNIGDNVIVFGNSVEINGNVSGDVVFFGGTLVLNGDVYGDVRAAGGIIYINSGVVNGDLLVAGFEVGVSSLTEIGGEVKVDGVNVNRNSDNNPTNLNGVDRDTILNSTTFQSITAGLIAGLTVFSIVWALIMLIGSVISGYVVLRLFPTFTEKTLITMQSRPWKAIASGCLVLFGGIIFAVLLLVSLVGFKLLWLLFVLFLLAMIMGAVYSKYLVGRLFLKRIGYPNSGRLLALIVGVLLIDVILTIFGFIPILNIFAALISFFLTIWGFGAIVLNKYESLQTNK